MANIKLGCEVYTWFMAEWGKVYDEKLDHMIEMTAKAGFTGIEPMQFWMGSYFDASKLKDALQKHNVELAAIALVLDWNNPTETDEEKKAADDTIALLKNFPGSKLCTVQMPSNRDNLEERRLNLVANLNAVSRRAKEAGIESSFHPNSPETSINRTEEDYNVIIPALDAEVTGWTPDVGHIANGGMNVLDKMKEWKHLINHMHYKDWDGNPEWTVMGEGKIDFPGITEWLKTIDYDGYIMCEDEAAQAVEDPDAVIMKDGEYCAEKIRPLIA